MKITLVVPTLNEITGMRQIMPRVKKEWVDQIIVLDGGSTDGTIEYALEQGYEVYRQKRRGIRLGLLENYPNIRGDVTISFSPDGNSVPELIPDLIAKMNEGYDMVIVSRYLGDAKSEDDTAITALGNRLFTLTINTLFGGHYTDTCVLFRGYKTKLLGELGIARVRSDFYEKWIGKYISCEPQLSVRCAKRRLKVAEIPGDEPRRVSDTVSSGNFFLPASRIHHFKSGFACLYMFLEEFLFWNR